MQGTINGFRFSSRSEHEYTAGQYGTHSSAVGESAHRQDESEHEHNGDFDGLGGELAPRQHAEHRIRDRDADQDPDQNAGNNVLEALTGHRSIEAGDTVEHHHGHGKEQRGRQHRSPRRYTHFRLQNDGRHHADEQDDGIEYDLEQCVRGEIVTENSQHGLSRLFVGAAESIATPE